MKAEFIIDNTTVVEFEAVLKCYKLGSLLGAVRKFYNGYIGFINEIEKDIKTLEFISKKYKNLYSDLRPDLKKVLNAYKEAYPLRNLGVDKYSDISLSFGPYVQKITDGLSRSVENNVLDDFIPETEDGPIVSASLKLTLEYSEERDFGIGLFKRLMFKALTGKSINKTLEFNEEGHELHIYTLELPVKYVKLYLALVSQGDSIVMFSNIFKAFMKE